MQMILSGRTSFAWLLVIWCSWQTLLAGNWPHWRGPNRDGRVAEDSGWDSGAWPLKKSLWSVNVGEGGSSPLVIDGRLYVMGWKDDTDVVSCIEVATGQEVWSVSYRCPVHGRRSTGDEGIYSGPTSTPEFDAETGYLYTLSCDGDLHCWDTRDKGRKVWAFNLYERYDVPRRPRYQRSGLRDYGYTTAPLHWKELIIVEVGDDEGNLMAFDRRTGERVWVSEYKGPAGHAGGIATMQVAGIPCVAVLSYEGLHVARIDAGHEGQQVALYPWPTDFANNIATPAVHDDCVLITSGYNHNAICKVRITLKGATKVWEQPLASKVCTPVIDRDRIYWAWQKLHCLDWETGQQQWEGGEFADAGSCVVTADGRLIVWGHHGRLVLVESAARSPKEYRELSRLDHVFSTDVWPHVALADGRLFCKDRVGNLKCFVIGGRKESQ